MVILANDKCRIENRSLVKTRARYTGQFSQKGGWEEPWIDSLKEKVNVRVGVFHKWNRRPF